MDKLTLAHDAALAMIRSGCSLHTAIADSWRYADAMQEEADKRNNTERPKVLFEPKFEVDWSQAPSNAEFYLMRSGEAVWSNGFSTICPAPSFGFTGTHVVERPHGF